MLASAAQVNVLKLILVHVYKKSRSQSVSTPLPRILPSLHFLPPQQECVDIMLNILSRLVMAIWENAVKRLVYYALLRQVLPLIPGAAQVNVLQLIFVHGYKNVADNPYQPFLPWIPLSAHLLPTGQCVEVNPIVVVCWPCPLPATGGALGGVACPSGTPHGCDIGCASGTRVLQFILTPV
jgi:hypothetical protein